jgi:plasmid stabilization system protein ParE
VNPKIRRSAQSVEDVYEIATYLLKDGLSIAERFLDAVESTFQTLGRAPLIGVPHARSRLSRQAYDAGEYEGSRIL